MVNLVDFDLRIATHYNTVARCDLPAWQQATQRAIVPGTLATKFLAMTARFAPRSRQAAARAATSTAHS